jgi:hypothetical protein
MLGAEEKSRYWSSVAKRYSGVLGFLRMHLTPQGFRDYDEACVTLIDLSCRRHSSSQE